MIELLPTPRILQVDPACNPKKWISIQDAISYYATDSILFEIGNPVMTYRAGINKLTQQITTFTTSSIIAVKGDSYRYSNRYPALTNDKLFERDQYLCAYCGKIFAHKHLSRDHVTPLCQKGKDVWANVVTSCKRCNTKKSGRTPEQAKMKLLYLPYMPDRYENFILDQGVKRILADQMDFLLSNVSEHSRLKLS